jgi:hypothetical protein
MAIPVPILVRIEYWNNARGEWTVGHASWNLLDPTAYVRKVTTRGTLARAVDIETGEIYNGSDLL